MIRTIKSKELKLSKADLTCAFCGRDHSTTANGKLIAVEDVDYVFETDGTDEWCICVECKTRIEC